MLFPSLGYIKHCNDGAIAVLSLTDSEMSKRPRRGGNLKQKPEQEGACCCVKVDNGCQVHKVNSVQQEELALRLSASVDAGLWQYHRGPSSGKSIQKKGSR